MRKALYILLTVLAGLLLSATAVYAAGRFTSEPPETAVYKGKVLLQKAHYGSWRWHVWSKKEGRWYFQQYVKPAEKISFPAGDSVRKGELLRQAYYRDAEPTKAIMKSYRTAAMTGEAQVIYPSIDTVVEKGRVVGWQLLFRLESKGHHYLKTRIVWERVEGRHYSYGQAAYYTHLVAR